MPISDRIAECVAKYNTNDLDNALIQICIAIDATAKKEYPKTKKVGERFKGFIKSNQDIITFFTFSTNIFIDCQFGKYTVEQFIYKVLRCGLLHEGDVPAMFQFAESGAPIEISDRQWRLPKTFILGAMLAVIGATSNAGQVLPDSMTVSIMGKTFAVNELWGHSDVVRNIIDTYMTTGRTGSAENAPASH
jgi:hypothetical protein